MVTGGSSVKKKVSLLPFGGGQLKPSKKMVPNEKSVACSVGSSLFLRFSTSVGGLLERDFVGHKAKHIAVHGSKGVSPAFM